MSAFITAVKSGNLQEIQHFLTHEGTRELINQQDSRTHESPLYCACVKGDLVVASCLLAHQARVDLKTKWLATPLHAAAHSGHENLVRLLLRNNSKPNEQTHFGDTALHLASSGNHLGVVKALLEAGTDITLLNSRGRNAIQEAEREGAKSVVEYLNKLYFEANSSKNEQRVVPSTSSPHPKNLYQRPQGHMTCYRSISEPNKKSNSWLHEISNGEYEFLGLQEDENDLSVVGNGSTSADPALKRLNIDPASDQNRLKYLEETITSLLTDYERTKEELKNVQSELNETRTWLRTCNSCHHCSKYSGKAAVTGNLEPTRYNNKTDRKTSQWDYRSQKNVHFESQ